MESLSIKSALSGHSVMEFHGIEPNPHLETLMKAAELVRRGETSLPAVGGSVLDGTKFIAAAVLQASLGHFGKQGPVTAALPLELY